MVHSWFAFVILSPWTIVQVLHQCIVIVMFNLEGTWSTTNSRQTLTKNEKYTNPCYYHNHHHELRQTAKKLEQNGSFQRSRIVIEKTVFSSIPFVLLPESQQWRGKNLTCWTGTILLAEIFSNWENKHKINQIQKLHLIHFTFQFKTDKETLTTTKNYNTQWRKKTTRKKKTC